MNEPATQPSGSGVDLRTITLVIYGCFIAGFLGNFIPMLGILPIVAVVIAFIKRADAAGTIYESHMQWVIRTFFIALIGVIIAFPLAMFGIGFVLMIAITIWSIYRLVKGGLKLLDGKAVDNPKAFF